MLANSVETLKGKAAERWIDRDDGRDRSRKGGDLNADSWRDDAPAGSKRRYFTRCIFLPDPSDFGAESMRRVSLLSTFSLAMRIA